MLKVGSILKSMSQYGQNSGVGSSFVNYLVHMCEADDDFTTDIVQSFFLESLEYPHWQQNKAQLSKEIRQVVDMALRSQSEGRTQQFDFESIQLPMSIQVIEIEDVKNWSEVVNSYLTFQHRGGEKFRLIHDELLNKMIAIVLKPDGQLLIRMFGRKFYIRSGSLTPLREDLSLLFDRNLELAQNTVHKIETAQYMTSLFFIENNQVFGNTVRGYFFQKIQDLNGDPLIAFPKIFYAIKRIEQHFLKRENDPFYQNLVDDIEHSVKMIRLGDESFINNAPDMLSRAQNAIDYVFPNDKLLTLLIRDLQYTMAGKKPADSSQVINKTAVKQARKDIEKWNNLQTPTLEQNQLIELTKPTPIFINPQRKYDLTN